MKQPPAILGRSFAALNTASSWRYTVPSFPLMNLHDFVRSFHQDMQKFTLHLAQTSFYIWTGLKLLDGRSGFRNSHISPQVPIYLWWLLTHHPSTWWFQSATNILFSHSVGGWFWLRQSSGQSVIGWSWNRVGEPGHWSSAAGYLPPPRLCSCNCRVATRDLYRWVTGRIPAWWHGAPAASRRLNPLSWLGLGSHITPIHSNGRSSHWRRPSARGQDIAPGLDRVSVKVTSKKSLSHGRSCCGEMEIPFCTPPPQFPPYLSSCVEILLVGQSS